MKKRGKGTKNDEGQSLFCFNADERMRDYNNLKSNKDVQQIL